MSASDATWEVGDHPAISPDAPTVPTTPQRSDRRALIRERRWRRGFFAALSIFLLLGVIGVFGARTSSSTTTGGAYTLHVPYPSVTRPGLATAFQIIVSRRDGAPLTGPVTVAVPTDYLAMFDINAITPAPSAEISNGTAVEWEFDSPAARTERLTIDLDARTEPGAQWGRDGYVQILEQNTSVAEVQFRTRVTP
jgi:hypothetical protein